MTISGEVTVVPVTWPQLAVTRVVSARPARCSDRVGVMFMARRSVVVDGLFIKHMPRTVQERWPMKITDHVR